MLLSRKRQWRRMVCSRRHHVAPPPPVPAPEGDGVGGRVTMQRTVSFHETARVLLVPSRRELLKLDHDAGTHGDGGTREETIWWKRKDLIRIKRSWRKQIYARGLQDCTTSLLLGDRLVHHIGQEEEKAEEDNKGAMA